MSLHTSQARATGAVLPIFEPLLTAEEASLHLRIHPKTLQRKARIGEIPGYLMANRWFFRASELDEWLKTRIHSGSQSIRTNEGA